MNKFLLGLAIYPILIFYWAWGMFQIWAWHLAPIFDPMGQIGMNVFVAVILIKALLYTKLNKPLSVPPSNADVVLFFSLPALNVLIAYLLV